MLYNLFRNTVIVYFVALFTSLCIFAADIPVSENQSEIPDKITLSQEQNELIDKQSKKVLEYFDFSNIFDFAKNSIFENIQTTKNWFFCVISILIISAVFGALKDSFGSTSSLYDFMSMLFLSLFIFIPIGNCIDLITEVLKKQCAYMSAFVPSMCAMYISGGNTATAASSAVVYSSAISILSVVGTNLIIPCAKISICLTIMSSISQKTDLSGVSAFLKSFSMWVTGLMLTLFTGVLSLQSFIQNSADNLAIRSARFSAARLIPVAGSMISDSLKTVISGVSFIKSVSGAVGIAFIVYTIIPPVVTLFCLKLFCLLSSAFAKLCGLSKQGALFENINASLNILGAVILCCGCAFIIMFAIFMKTCIHL